MVLEVKTRDCDFRDDLLEKVCNDNRTLQLGNDATEADKALVERSLLHLMLVTGVKSNTDVRYVPNCKIGFDSRKYIVFHNPMSPMAMYTIKLMAVI